MDHEEFMGLMICLTGLMIAVPAFGYSTMVHTKKMKVKAGNHTAGNLFLMWLTILLIPFAIEFQSRLIGHFVFMLVFGFLGFRIVYFLGGMGIGWHNRSDMFRSCVSAGLMVLIFQLLYCMGIRGKYLYPFSQAIYT